MLGLGMMLQAATSTISKLQIPFSVFIPLYTIQLLSTACISWFYNERHKISFDLWMIFSLVFAILTGFLTLFSSFAGEPAEDERLYYPGIMLALHAAGTYSLILVQIDRVSVYVINRTPSFAAVLEMVISSSFFGTIFAAGFFFMCGEHHNIERDLSFDGFSKGKIVYVWTMVGQAVAWQVYWVGIVGIVFSVSTMFANVISVCTWPIVSLLVACFLYADHQYDVFIATALATAALSVSSYLYLIHREDTRGYAWKLKYLLNYKSVH